MLSNTSELPVKRSAPRSGLLLIELKNNSGSIGQKLSIPLGNPASISIADAKLDAEIASAMMSINAGKGVEIGEGMNVTNLKGSENSDEIFAEKGKIKFIPPVRIKNKTNYKKIPKIGEHTKKIKKEFN